MTKITELTVQRMRTTHHRDRSGKLVRGQQSYLAKRKVKTVKSGPRFAHFFVDFIVFQIVVTLVQFFFLAIQTIIGHEGILATGLFYFSNIFLILLYPFLYFISEYYWQTTLGKILTKSVVINEYGEKPSMRQIILRSIIRLVPFEPFSCAGDTHSYGWHDSWSETFVVPKDELKLLKELQAEQHPNKKD